MILFEGDRLAACFSEARLLVETLARMAPGLDELPRAGGQVDFKYDADGKLHSVFVHGAPAPTEQ